MFLQKHGTGALVISALLDFFTFAICPPYRYVHIPFLCVLFPFHMFPFHASETTDADKFDMVLELIAGVGRVMFKLFQHPSLAIVKAAGLIMKSIIEVMLHTCDMHATCTCTCTCRKGMQRQPPRCRSWHWLKGLSLGISTPPSSPPPRTTVC